VLERLAAEAGWRRDRSQVFRAFPTTVIPSLWRNPSDVRLGKCFRPRTWAGWVLTPEMPRTRKQKARSCDRASILQSS